MLTTLALVPVIEQIVRTRQQADSRSTLIHLFGAQVGVRQPARDLAHLVSFEGWLATIVETSVTGRIVRFATGDEAEEEIRRENRQSLEQFLQPSLEAWSRLGLSRQWLLSADGAGAAQRVASQAATLAPILATVDPDPPRVLASMACSRRAARN